MKEHDSMDGASREDLSKVAIENGCDVLMLPIEMDVLMVAIEEVSEQKHPLGTVCVEKSIVFDEAELVSLEDMDMLEVADFEY